MYNEFEKYLRYTDDKDVDDVLDTKLRTLLSRCFAHEPLFKTQRFYHVLPKHRWMIEVNGELGAHLAAHELEFEVDGVKSNFVGIAEVCVAPEYRGHKLVGLMLSKAESVHPDIQYSILLGNPDIYGSSGYKKVTNVYFPEVSDKPCDAVLVKCLNGAPWPDGKITIKGLHF